MDDHPRAVRHASVGVPLLPGVERHPERPSAFVVDRKIARWMALELFHLLGFRRVGAKGRFVVMGRRDFDYTRNGPRG